MTRADVQMLESRRAELSRQLMSAVGRRDELAEQILNTADPAVRSGLQDRLELLDARILDIERRIAENGARLAEVPSSVMEQPVGRGPFGRLDADQITGITIVFTIFVLFPVALSFARMLWKRATTPRLKPNTADSERLERVEHAIETIAIEVERISEGQRFVTRLLAQPNGVPVEAVRRQQEHASASDPRGRSGQ